MIFVVDVAGASDSVREPFDITTYIARTGNGGFALSLIHISEPTRQYS